MLFRSPKRTRPQRYYPSVLRADVLENLMQKGNVPIHLTEVTSSHANSKAPISNLEVLILLPGWAWIELHLLEILLS
jgi:hypothetical protein